MDHSSDFFRSVNIHEKITAAVLAFDSLVINYECNVIVEDAKAYVSLKLAFTRSKESSSYSEV